MIFAPTWRTVIIKIKSDIYIYIYIIHTDTDIYIYKNDDEAYSAQ